MSKTSTIASLNRQASKDETEFFNVVQELVDAGEHDRTAEFFDRLNIPRSVGCDTCLQEIPKIKLAADKVGTWSEEREISMGVQRFMDRHERKLRWHATHPLEGSDNAMMLVRCAMSLTVMRLERLGFLLQRHDELTPEEWAIARELMNRSYIAFRNMLNILAGEWIDAMQAAVPRDELGAKLGNFYEFVDGHLRILEEYRTTIEERRVQLTVTPPGFPPVKPPNYFGGDLMGRGPWKQFWATVDNRAHHFREAAG